MTKTKKNILVVDDDPVMVKILETKLTEWGYFVLSSTQAADGLQKAMNKSPDLIILDVMMPIINGYNFCKLLKQEESKKHIPIILLTHRDAWDDIEIGREMGADAYLIKPVDIVQLKELIEKFVA